MTKSLKFAALAAAGVAAAGFLAPLPAAAQDVTLTVASWGGAYSASQRNAFYIPYKELTGVTILEDEWQGDIAQIRVQVEIGVYKWDIIDGEQDIILSGCDEGILAEIDYDMMGGREQFFDGAALDCGVANITWSTIYAYDGEVFPASGPVPSTVGDFFDTEKFPGMRGFYRQPKINLEWALIADGVPIDQVYEVLATEEGVDRALAKFDTIKDQILWWESGAQSVQILADKEVVMTSSWNGRIYNAVANEGKNFPIVWGAQGLELDFWFMPAGGPNQEEAMKFIAWSEKPEIQKNQSKFIAYGPTTAAAAALIEPDILKDLPTAPANTKNVLTVDNAFWADRREELTEIWNAWISQ